MRKLTVKNFSVIKEAELEFGKITVLIGPQASGKSLLCKLAYFLSKEVIQIAMLSSNNGLGFDQFKAEVNHEFIKRFCPSGSISNDVIVEFSSGEHFIRALGTMASEQDLFEFQFSKSFQNVYFASQENTPVEKLADISMLDRQSTWWAIFNRLFFDTAVESRYIPAGRSFFTDANKGFLALQNAEIDPLIREFASEIIWSPRWKANLYRKTDSDLDKLSATVKDIVGGEVKMNGNEVNFIDKKGRLTPLSFLSSGTQELLPLLHVMERWAYLQEHRQLYGAYGLSAGVTKVPPTGKFLVYLEEPEANIFPSTQYQLVQLFAQLSYEPSWDFSWVITTHSPYILSSFNNLIYAGQLSKDKAIRRKIPIDKKYWIEPGTFAAYSIHHGKLESILSESGLIDGEYLDSVSEKIGNEFDSLLRLEYDKVKAS
ncbi:MAG: AAA family ATPase [Terracidiphilus sp.]|jgi:predicted ATPase